MNTFIVIMIGFAIGFFMGKYWDHIKPIGKHLKNDLESLPAFKK